MSEIKQINVPNIVIPKFGTNEVWLNGVPFVPNNDPPVTLQTWFPDCGNTWLCQDAQGQSG